MQVSTTYCSTVVFTDPSSVNNLHLLKCMAQQACTLGERTNLLYICSLHTCSLHTKYILYKEVAENNEFCHVTEGPFSPGTSLCNRAKGTQEVKAKTKNIPRMKITNRVVQSFETVE